MKKVICFMIVLLSLCTMGYCENGTNEFSLSIYLSTLTDDEVLEIRDLVQSEIESRNLGTKSEKGFVPWSDYGIGQMLPDPSAYFGHSFTNQADGYDNDEYSFKDSIKGITSEEFRKYTDLLVSIGFNCNVEKIGDNFMAKNKDKVEVTAVLREDVMTIDLFDYTVFDK